MTTRGRWGLACVALLIAASSARADDVVVGYRGKGIVLRVTPNAPEDGCTYASIENTTGDAVYVEWGYEASSKSGLKSKVELVPDGGLPVPAHDKVGGWTSNVWCPFNDLNGKKERMRNLRVINVKVRVEGSEDKVKDDEAARKKAEEDRTRAEAARKKAEEDRARAEAARRAEEDRARAERERAAGERKSESKTHSGASTSSSSTTSASTTGNTGLAPRDIAQQTSSTANETMRRSQEIGRAMDQQLTDYWAQREADRQTAERRRRMEDELERQRLEVEKQAAEERKAAEQARQAAEVNEKKIRRWQASIPARTRYAEFIHYWNEQRKKPTGKIRVETSVPGARVFFKPGHPRNFAYSNWREFPTTTPVEVEVYPGKYLVAISYGGRQVGQPATVSVGSGTVSTIVVTIGDATKGGTP